MATKKFGYVRVSTREQNPERQIHILRDEEGIDERDIYVEKESGRKFERPVYRSLVDNILREGDLLVVTELKRFGRNYGEIYKEWFHITKEIGADIKVTSMPILDTTQSKELVGQLITDVVLAVFAYVADEDWTERHELQRQGIEVAKAGGKHLGRPRVEYPENWEDCYGRWKSGVISAKEAMMLTGLKKDSFYRLAKKYREDKLEYGDYSFMFPAAATGEDIYFHRDCVVERKASLEELSGNLTGERKRFEKEFLKAGNDGCKVYLMVEAPGGYSDT